VMNRAPLAVARLFLRLLHAHFAVGLDCDTVIHFNTATDVLLLRVRLNPFW